MSAAKISAKFRLADALRKLDDKYLPLAIQKYKEIDDLLKVKPNPYQANADEEKRANNRVDYDGKRPDFPRTSFYRRDL